MPVAIHHDKIRHFVEVTVSGKLTKSDYQAFVPELERLVEEHGKLRILFALQDFHGWTAGAAWEDIKFDVKHFHDVERLAVVGEKQWHEGMTTLFKPFTKADVRYFELADPENVERARVWLETGEMPEPIRRSTQAANE